MLGKHEQCDYCHGDVRQYDFRKVCCAVRLVRDMVQTHGERKGRHTALVMLAWHAEDGFLEQVNAALESGDEARFHGSETPARVDVGAAGDDGATDDLDFRAEGFGVDVRANESGS